MRAFYGCAAIAIALSALVAPPAWGQSLANGGFEVPITTDGPPCVGSWGAVTSGTGAQAVNSTAMPRTGAQNLPLAIDHTDSGFAAVFQAVPHRVPRPPVTFPGPY